MERTDRLTRALTESTNAARRRELQAAKIRNGSDFLRQISTIEVLARRLVGMLSSFGGPSAEAVNVLVPKYRLLWQVGHRTVTMHGWVISVVEHRKHDVAAASPLHLLADGRIAYMGRPLDYALMRSELTLHGPIYGLTCCFAISIDSILADLRRLERKLLLSPQ